jgi:hypothetical protein
MIKFFRLSKLNFLKQNQLDCAQLVEIPACRHLENSNSDRPELEEARVYLNEI